MSNDRRFPKRVRLLRRLSFERVYGRRRRAADEVLVIHGCENELGNLRLGLTVSRKIGNAVKRNRWKRIIREAFRQSRHELSVGIDLVVSPQGRAKPDMAAVLQSFRTLTRRLERILGAVQK